MKGERVNSAGLQAGGIAAVFGSPRAVEDALGRVEDAGQVWRQTLGERQITVASMGAYDALFSSAEDERWAVFAWGYFYASPSPGTEEDATSWRSVDAHSILTALKQRGPSSLVDAHGSFVLLAVDREAGSVYFKSDPSQVRRWSVNIQGGLLVASNKLHALQRIAGPLEEDVDSRDYYFVYGYHPLTRSLYKDTQRLDGGTVYAWDGARLAPLPRTPAGSVQPSPDADIETAADRLYTLLLNAVVAQTRGLKRAAVLLGGFDSALVASLAVRAGLEVETFSFHYEDETFNQPHTDTVARHLGLRHNWVHIDREVISEGLASYARTFDAPTNWANYPIQTARVCEEIAKKGFDIILTGDGCDALFYGFPGVFKSFRLFESLSRLPVSTSRRLLSTLSKLGVESLAGHPARVLLRIVRASAYEQPFRSFFMYRTMDETSVARFTQRNPSEVERSVERLMQQVASTLPQVSSTRLAYLGKNATAPSKTKLAGTGDLSGLPLFSPYMHPSVADLVRHFPDHWLRPPTKDKARKDLGKYILVKMTQSKKLLPDEVTLQKKVSAVNAPVEDWYRGPLRPQLEEALSHLPFRYSRRYTDALFHRKALEDAYARYLSTDALTSHALMLMVTYASYFR